MPVEIPSILLKPSIDDTERDEKIIRDNFMKELCVRDRNAQRKTSSAADFSIDEIIDRCLGAFSKD